MIYNLLDCVIMECYRKPLHLIPGVVVTPEYWFESFEIVESGFEGGDAEGAQHAMPPGARAQQEGPADAAVPPPLPPRPRRVQARQVTRWSGLTAKEIVDDLVSPAPCPGPASAARAPARACSVSPLAGRESAFPTLSRSTGGVESGALRHDRISTTSRITTVCRH